MTVDRRRFVEALVDEYLGPRLAAAGAPPGLREAVIDLVIRESTATDDLMREQLRHLRHPNSLQMPDAYLAIEAVADDALQRAAAGLRTALAVTGHLVATPDFEAAFATDMDDDAHVAVRAEMARTPRPLSRPELLKWSVEPVPWFNETADTDESWPPPGAQALADRRFLPGGPSALAQIEDGPQAGWMQIAFVEQHATPARRYPRQPARQVLMMLGLESADGDYPSDSLPFTRSSWKIWTVPWRDLNAAGAPQMATEHLARGRGPLTALTDGGSADPDHVSAGIGCPPFLLAPVFTVVVALDLVPTPGLSGLSLSDSDGPGLIARTWRGHAVHDGNYHPTTPAVEGTDLLLRPDLFEQLRAVVGDALRGGLVVSQGSGSETGPDVDD